MKHILFILTLVITPASAQIFYSGGTYAQDFDSLQNSSTFVNYSNLPNGWATSQSFYWFSTGFTGLSNNGDTYSFSSAPDAQDKALGIVVTSAAQQRFFGVHLVNSSNDTLTQFNISYLVEQWRKGAVVDSNQSVFFEYGIGASSLTTGAFTPFAPLDMHSIHDGDGIASGLDGNASENQVRIEAVISDISWMPGESLWLRWRGERSQFTQTHALAIDNFEFLAVPEPSAFQLLLTIAILLGVVCWRSQRG